MVWRDGGVRMLEPLSGDAYCHAAAINAAGQIVGWSESESGRSRAVPWSDGQVIDLGALPLED